MDSEEESNQEVNQLQIAIEIKNLSYSIDGVEILKNISALVQKRKRVGIIGPNGSGKTTLLKHIYRAIPPEKKTVFVYGKEIESLPYRNSAQSITVVKQENASDFDFSVEEMVMLGRAPYRKHFESFTTEDREKALSALRSIGMSAYAKRSYNNLSGGEKQRVLIARSLAQDADIFILDEPTNHLDVYYQWALMKIIKDLNVTAIGVFHELNLAAYFCEYLYVLDNGQLVKEGKPRDILTSETLSEVFKVKTEIINSPEQPLRILVQGAVEQLANSIS